VAICRHCGKALCQECVVETEEGIACHGRCERRVGEMSELLNRAERDARGYRSLGIVLVVGAVMLAVFTMALPGIAQQIFGKGCPTGVAACQRCRDAVHLRLRATQRGGPDLL
jgi:hypothetical protein